MPDEVENTAPRDTVSAFGNLRAGINTAGDGGGASVPDGGSMTPSTAPATETKADNSSIVAAPAAAPTEKPKAAEAPIVGKPTETVLIDDRKPAPAAKAEPAKAEPAAAEEAPAAEETEAEPEAEKTSAPESDLAAWKKQAEKFGYEIDPSGRVYNSERAKFRREKQEARSELDRARQEAFSQLETKHQELAGQMGPLLAFKQAVDAGDFDAIARSIGHKDWANLQGEAVAQASDPAYKRMRELERKEAEREAAARQYQEQQRQQQEAHQRTEGLKVYKAQLTKDLQASTDPLAKALHWDPIFVNEVTAMQQKHWVENGTPLSVEQIIKHDMNGTKTYFRKMYDALKGVFADGEKPQEAKKAEAAPEAKAAPAAAAKPAAPARPSIVQVSTSGSITPGGSQLPDPQSDAWFTYWARVAAEREAEAQSRGKNGKR